MLLATLLAAALPVAPQEPVWRVVRGAPERVGSLTYQRIGEVYAFGAPFEVVRPEQQGDASTSRIVVGTPDGNEAVPALLAALGVERRTDGLAVADVHVPDGSALVVVADDPDGGGRLRLFTGPDEAGVFAGFQASLDVTRDGFLVVRDRRVVARGTLGTGGVASAFELARPVVVRLDRVQETLRAEARGLPAADAQLFLERTLAGHARALAAVGLGTPREAARALSGAAAGASIDATRTFFGERELGRELLALVERTRATLAPADARPRPVYTLVHGARDATNAILLDPDPQSGRPQVVLNLAALARGRHFEAAVVHETVHALQPPNGPRLVDRAVREGVATLLSQVVLPELADADALLWSDAELAAARERREAVLTAFRARQDATDRAAWRDLVTLGVPLAAVEGAPSRCGYFVGWLAARAWLAQPGRTPAELLEARYADVFAALR